MAVEAEAADDQALEVPDEEVGQVERAGLIIGEGREGGATGVDLVAVGALESGDALAFEHPIEQAARAAVGVGDEDRVIALGARTADPGRNGAGYALRPVVE